MKKVVVIGVILVLLCGFKGKEKVRIFIAGDSTAQNYDVNKTLQRGWGQMLQAYFTDEVKVVNHAIGGRSTKTFINENRWEKLLNEVRKGDYVFIQFGHNDASTRPERHTSYADYQTNLIKFVTEVREKGANPVLLTSVVMRTYKNKVLVDDRLKGYPAITREVAETYNVPLIDINQKTRDLILMMGDQPSKALYMWVKPGEDPSKPDGGEDDTHLREEGAQRVAEMVAKEVKRQKLKGLGKYVK
ncbi:MAG: rhamnogalacturonan acetylesterase [Odoribacter sp.]|nr:rhamnogalacturonan acetylesterase [Odoribacter sp.]